MLISQVKSCGMGKGLGSFQADEGGEDIFLSPNAVERIGLWELPAGRKGSFMAMKGHRSGTIAVSGIEIV